MPAEAPFSFGIVRIEAEHFPGAKIVLRPRQVRNEVFRIQVVRFVWIDEDIGKRGRCVADVRHRRQGTNDLSDRLVDLGGTVVSGRCIYRRLIAFVVDDECLQ